MKPKFRNLLVAGSALLTISYAHASTLYWDGADTGPNAQGGAGTWITGGTNWDALAFGGADTAWANGDTAVFGGTAGTATIGTGGVTVGGLTFNTTAYTIAAGTNGLTFSSGNNSVSNIMVGATTAATITGTVGGTGANLILSSHPLSNSTLTFSGISAGGWTGTTTINSNYTLATTTTSGNINRVLNSTSGITLNGGAIQFNRATNAGLGAISDTAAITVNGGGTFGVTSADAGGASANETIGAVTVNSGQMNFNWTNGASSGAQMILGASGSGNLVVNGTGAVTFSGALGTTGRWKVTGAGSTTPGEIIGAWATTGAANGIGAQNDYAVYASDFVAAAGIAATAESAWSISHAIGSNYTLQNPGGASASAANGRLTATRNVNTVRNTSGVANITSVDTTLETITITGSSFANGDVVQVGGTAPGGLANNAAYYVVGASGASFQLASTPGGTAINLTSAGTGNVGGGITLSSGNNLGTFGILNGSTAFLPIGRGTTGGQVTLPTNAAGNLYVTAGSAGIGIDAPIVDPGTGNGLTLVKGGSSGLFLSGTNTYTGGTVVNSGTLQFNNAGSWVSGQDLSFGGAGTVVANFSGTLTGGTLKAEQGAVAVINGLSAITFSSTTGTGTIVRNGGNGNVGNLNLGNAGGFTGNLQISQASGTNPRPTVVFSNLGDGGALQYGGGQGDSNQKVTFQFNGSSPLTWDTRQVQILPRSGGNNAARSMILENNSTDAANTLTINTDLLNSGDRTNQGFILGGSNTGNNTFGGDIGNSTLNGAALNLYKSGAGKWILSGTNTFTGGIAVNGTLSVGTLNDNVPPGPLGSGSNSIQLGGIEQRFSGTGTENILGGTTSGTLEYTGGAVTSARAFFVGGNVAGDTGGGGINNNGSGAITFTATNFNPTQAGITATRTLTLGGSNTGTNDIQGIIQDNTATTGKLNLTKSNAGTWRLSSADSTYSGVTTLSGGGGILEVSKLADGGSNSSIGTSPNAATNLLLGNTSTLRYVGAGDSTDRSFTINGTAAGNQATLDASGSGAINFTNTASPAYGTANQSRVLFLAGTNTGDNTLAANIANNGSGAVQIQKNGTGKWVLTGTNSFSGAVTVANGTLSIPTINNAATNGTLGNQVAGTAVVLGSNGNTGVLSYTGTGAPQTAGTISNKTFSLATGGTGVIEVTNAGSTLTLSNNTASQGIIGAGNFEKKGPGILALQGGNAASTYSGSTTISEGTLQLGLNTTSGALSLNTTSITIASGASLAINRSNAVTQAAGGILGNGTIPLTGDGSFVQMGGGVTTLTLGNTYTGGTTVSNGTLLVNNTSGSGTGTGSVTVGATGTLGGTGVISGAVNVTGVLSPGASIQSLATGALNMASGSTFVYEAADNTPTGADLLGVNGGLTLSGVILSLDPTTLSALGAGGWSGGDKLTLISYIFGGTEVTSGFTDGTNPYLDDTNYSFGSNVWTFNYNDTTAGGNFLADATANGQNRFVTFTLIPEPSTALLGALGAMLLLRRRR
ncbi:autotransporter-associated beta strand repeat-containing protein [Akkermansiaceae bacterium]|nr:autotransporter-associated beta strand repeat-containing protein [Akkermansiaceae bacterium]